MVLMKDKAQLVLQALNSRQRSIFIPASYKLI